MYIAQIGMVGAAAAGALFASAAGYDPASRGDLPSGPQQVLSQPTAHPTDGDAYATTSPSVGAAGNADYIIGTDWLPGGRHSPPQMAAIFDLPPLPEYEPLRYADVTMPPVVSISDTSVELATVEAITERSDEFSQVLVADDQGGRQIDDVDHRPDPGPALGEPSI